MGSLSLPRCLPTLALTSWIFLGLSRSHSQHRVNQGLSGLTVSDETAHDSHLTSETQHQPLASPYYNYNQAEVGSDLVSPYYPDYSYNQPSAPTALSSGND